MNDQLHDLKGEGLGACSVLLRVAPRRSLAPGFLGLAASAVLADLVVVVTLGLRPFGGSPREMVAETILIALGLALAALCLLSAAVTIGVRRAMDGLTSTGKGEIALPSHELKLAEPSAMAPHETSAMTEALAAELARLTPILTRLDDTLKSRRSDDGLAEALATLTGTLARLAPLDRATGPAAPRPRSAGEELETLLNEISDLAPSRRSV